VEVGLYTCIVPVATYALLGGSRRMSLSTTSTIVALTGAAIAAAGAGGDPAEAMAAATTLTLLVGVILLVGRILRLGFVVEAISEAVVSGLKVGVGLSIAASQLPNCWVSPKGTTASSPTWATPCAGWTRPTAGRWPSR
jgi:MFS superfamily sulfate permease-like transporter